jgi:hypothetical protein
VRQTRIQKHRSRPVGWKQTPLRLDGRDPDIVKAHQLARNPGWQGPDSVIAPHHPNTTSPGDEGPPGVWKDR